MLAIAENAQQRLKPGMFVEIDLRGNTARDVLQVPHAALQHYAGATCVFVRSGPGKFERRDVAIGRPTSELVEITSGLTENEAVVVKGGFALKSEMLGDLMAEE